MTRGDRVTIKASAVPEDAIDHKALVIFSDRQDPKVGTFHLVMFNAGTGGVIFKHVLDSEIEIDRLDDDTCQVSGSGPQQLCAVWDDPQFQADQNAFYYARVVEAPTCRWLTRQCMNAPADLDCSNNPQEEWAACCEIENGNAPSRIQERAWASPIWYKQ